MEDVLTQKYKNIYNFMYYFSRIGLILVSLIFYPICWIISKRKGKNNCPTIKDPLLFKSATELAHMIRTRQVTCETVIRAYINRAVEINKIVNAIVEDRFAQALEDSIELDRNISDNFKSVEEMQTQTPLLGVPITIKESIMVKGMSCDVGQFNSNCIADRDSIIVQRVKNAGAIIIAVTNTPEICFFWETFNKVTGLTKNPYDTTRTVGGSSGGEAALISSAASLIGLGSDLAGSLRLPAFFTGIFSHKPTSKLTPIDNNKPKIHDKYVDEYLVTGPMTRYAEDLPLLMSILASSDNNFHCKKVQLENIKVYYMENESSSSLAKNVDGNIINAMKLFGSYLKGKYNASVEKIQIEHFHYSFPVSIDTLLGMEKVECVYLDRNLEFHFWPEFFRFITFRSESTLPIFFYGIIKYLHYLFLRKDENEAQNFIKHTKEYTENLLGENGILLYPTFPTQAHLHYSMFHKVMDFSYASIFNVLGLPVTNCPAGFANNLPIGFQIVAKSHNDELTLAIAREAEIYFDGWKPPERITIV